MAKKKVVRKKRNKLLSPASKRKSYSSGSEINALIQTVAHLRSPQGCPWDRAQTHQSLRPYLIEEAYEVLEVLDKISSSKDLRRKELREEFCEELGDLLMQVVLHAQLASEAGAFTVNDVARALRKKLLRRHPHVFGEERANKAEGAFVHWEREKAREKRQKKSGGILSGLPRELPALQRAARVIEKVTKVGFQWPDMRGPLAKLEEEFLELKQEILEFERTKNKKLRARIEAELGDLLFCMSNLAFLLKVQPEQALRGNLRRFEERFRYLERRLAEQGKNPEDVSLEEMDRYWQEAKALESKSE